jgi:hypothetical protein
LPTPPFWFVMAMIKRLSPFPAMAGEFFIDHEKKKSKGQQKIMRKEHRDLPAGGEMKMSACRQFP